MKITHQICSLCILFWRFLQSSMGRLDSAITFVDKSEYVVLVFLLELREARIMRIFLLCLLVFCFQAVGV